MGSTQVGEMTVRATMQVNNKWVEIDPLANDPAIVNGGAEAGTFFARRSRDPARATRLAKARKKLGNALALNSTYGTGAGLVALRMKAGLSQTELAQRMNTQQPSIARWERSPEGMSFSNMEAWAIALKVDISEVFAAIKAQSAPKNKALEHETA